MEHDLNYHGPVVILDLDDTLYPEIEFVKSGYRAVADSIYRRDGIDPDKSIDVMMSAFKSSRNPFDSLLEYFHEISRPEGLIPLCLSVYRYHTPHLTLPEASHKFLQTLQQQGIRMALVTDGRAITQWAKIKALDIQKYFSPADIWISEERGAHKTEIYPWRAIACHYPEASRFFTIGDNPAKDFQLPNMLGFTTICLRNSGNNIHPQDNIPSDMHKPSFTIDELTEAIPIILAQ